MDGIDEDGLDDRGWLKVPNRKIKTTKTEQEDGSILYKHEWSFEPLFTPGEPIDVLKEIRLIAEHHVFVSCDFIDIFVKEEPINQTIMLSLVAKIEDVCWYHKIPFIGSLFPVKKQGKVSKLVINNDHGTEFYFHYDFYFNTIKKIVDKLDDWLVEREKYNNLGLFERVKTKKKFSV